MTTGSTEGLCQCSIAWFYLLTLQGHFSGKQAIMWQAKFNFVLQMSWCNRWRAIWLLKYNKNCFVYCPPHDTDKVKCLQESLAPYFGLSFQGLLVMMMEANYSAQSNMRSTKGKCYLSGWKTDCMWVLGCQEVLTVNSLALRHSASVHIGTVVLLNNTQN